MNATTAYPFYYADRSDIFTSISDQKLALVAPILAYWIYSFSFHLLDCSNWAWVERYRIHESDEIKSRNVVSISEVIRAVLLQHVIQTALGLWWIESAPPPPNHLHEMARLTPSIARALSFLLGGTFGRRIMLTYGPRLVAFVYWWGIPSVQLLLALLFIDTWQYFLHRAFHINTFLYRRFHSVHHRLYVPYAFGALYNHWIEGLILDSLGAAIAEKICFMTVRQAAFLFTFSTLKTVDDHCGYAIPWDPFQILFGNNAAYHDIHHRTWGTKHNFSQPFFVHFDVIFGTRYDGPAPTDKTKSKSKTA